MKVAFDIDGTDVSRDRPELPYARWEYEPGRIPKLYADDAVVVVFRLVESEGPNGNGARRIEQEFATRTMQGAVDALYRIRGCSWGPTISNAISELTGFWVADPDYHMRLGAFVKVPDDWGRNIAAVPAAYRGCRGPYRYVRDVLALLLEQAVRCAFCGGRIHVNRRKVCPLECWAPPRNLSKDEKKKFGDLHKDTWHATCSLDCHFRAVRLLRLHLRNIRDERLALERLGGEIKAMRQQVKAKKAATPNNPRTRLETWTSMRSRLGKLPSLV